MLKDGKNIAQVSDAGMPSISDPGHELVEACAAEGIRVIALPGPSASLTALIASGLVPQPFLFYGFLPRKKTEQVAALEKLNSQTVTMIFYEAPHRLNKTFAVVDLETTGTKMDGTNRIIQFSCVLVQNRKIVNTLSITIQSDLPAERGMGSSAAVAVALIRASSPLGFL